MPKKSFAVDDFDDTIEQRCRVTGCNNTPTRAERREMNPAWICAPCAQKEATKQQTVLDTTEDRKRAAARAEMAAAKAKAESQQQKKLNQTKSNDNVARANRKTGATEVCNQFAAIATKPHTGRAKGTGNNRDNGYSMK